VFNHLSIYISAKPDTFCTLLIAVAPSLQTLFRKLHLHPYLN